MRCTTERLLRCCAACRYGLHCVPVMKQKLKTEPRLTDSAGAIRPHLNESRDVLEGRARVTDSEALPDCTCDFFLAK